MEPLEILHELDACFSQIMGRGFGKDGLKTPLSWREAQDNSELASLVERLDHIFYMVNEAYRYAEAIANGELNMEVSRGNVFAMPLKALNANLRHLTWQAHQIAEGDLNQQVHFLGDFSSSFNRMIEALRDKQIIEQRLQTITDVIGEGVCLVDIEGCLTFMNPEAEKLLGYRFDELEGKNLHQHIHQQRADGTLLSAEDCFLVKAISKGREYRDDDIIFTSKSGLVMPVSVVCRPIWEEGQPTGAVLAFHDISEQKRHQESLKTINELLEKQATTDALTGTYNRLKLSELLEHQMARARRYEVPLSVMLFDIDHFKKINDTFGHLVGDEILKEIARLVKGNIRKSDSLARWGGEEFLVVVSDCGLKETELFAGKLCALIAGHDFPTVKTVTASFGVTTLRQDDTEMTLIARADEALYAAKRNGRNRIESC